MKYHRLVGVVVACGLMMVVGTAQADKAAVEKRAKGTTITLSLKDTSVDAALDMISAMSGIAIKKANMPKNPPAVTLELKDVSVLDGIGLVVNLAGLTYVIGDDGISVSGKTNN